MTTLTELVRLDSKEAQHVAWKFEHAWLSRYPRPFRVIRDAGNEFKGEFERSLQRAGIDSKTTSVRNAAANAVCERMHQTAGNILRTLCHTHPPQTIEHAQLLVDKALATAQLALRVTQHSTLGSSPGAIVFGRESNVSGVFFQSIVRLFSPLEII